MIELRAVEDELDYEDPRGDAYAESIALLGWQLRKAARRAGRIRDMSLDYVPVADDGFVRLSENPNPL